MPRLNRRPVLLLPLLAAAATVALSACGNAGVAEQSKEHSVVTGAQGQVGDIQLLDASLTIGDAASAATLSVTIYDQGQDGDSLTGVSSPASTAADFQLPADVGTSPSTNATAGVGSSSSGPAATATTGAGDTSSTAVAIPAMQAVPLEQSDAIAVSGLTGSPQVGDSVPVTFSFAGAGQITLDVPVVGSDAPASGSTPTPAVTGANVDGGNGTPAVPAASG